MKTNNEIIKEVRTESENEIVVLDEGNLEAVTGGLQRPPGFKCHLVQPIDIIIINPFPF